MNKMTTAAIAALALAAIIPTSAKADEPVNPVQGAVCNLYLLKLPTDNSNKEFNEIVSSLPRTAAAATFVDSASDFKPAEKAEGISSTVGMWTGWMKVAKAGTYTFTCKRGRYNYDGGYRYSIWINGNKCLEGVFRQNAFNVDLDAGFNEVKIVVGAYLSDEPCPLTITYKKSGSVKDPISFGPENMFYDDEE